MTVFLLWEVPQEEGLIHGGADRCIGAVAAVMEA